MRKKAIFWQFLRNNGNFLAIFGHLICNLPEVQLRTGHVSSAEQTHQITPSFMSICIPMNPSPSRNPESVNIFHVTHTQTQTVNCIYSLITIINYYFMKCSKTWAFSDMTLYLILTILLYIHVYLRWNNMCNKELNWNWIELYLVSKASGRNTNAKRPLLVE